MSKIEAALLVLSIHQNDLAITEHRARQLRKEAENLDVMASKIRRNIDLDKATVNSALFDIMLRTTTRKFLKLCEYLTL